MTFPREHWAQIASTNPLERLNGEIKRRSDVVGISPNDRAAARLVGALMLEQTDVCMDRPRVARGSGTVGGRTGACGRVSGLGARHRGRRP